MIIKIVDGYQSKYKGQEVDDAVGRAQKAAELDGNNTFTGSNTFSGTVDFSGSVYLGGNATVETPDSSDDSDRVASTSFVKLQNYLTTITANDVKTALGYTPEDEANKVIEILSSATDVQYPSAKAVYSVTSANASAIAANTASIQADHSTIEEHTLTLSEHGSLITANTASIAADHSTIVSHTSAIQANTASIAADHSTIVSHTSAIQANAASIQANYSTIQVHTSAIAANTASIQANYSTIQVHTSAIQANTASIAADHSTIENHTSAIAANTASIAADHSTIENHTSAINTINSKIPSEASSTNKLADKDFVNSSIATNTANFIGTFDSVSSLEAYSGTVTNNDYAFVVNRVVTDNGSDWATVAALNNYNKTLLTNFDYAWVINGSNFDLYRFDMISQTWDLRGSNITKESVTLNTAYNRYKATVAGSSVTWAWEYTLNNSSFTAAQWIAINSGATPENINQIAINTGSIAANATAIATNTASIQADHSTIVSHTSTLASHASAIQANTSAITANTLAIQTNVSAIATNTSAIAANTASIQANYSTIQANTSAIAANTSLIGDLQTSKQDVIADLGTIRAGASLGSTAVQPSAIADMQVKSNLVTSISATSTNTTYPSAKLLYNELQLKQDADGAVTHTKNTAVGNVVQPVYVDSDGVVQSCTYELNKTVPSDAVFTDTKNTTGSSNSVAKLFIVGAQTQAASAQTYSQTSAFIDTSGVLNSSHPSSSSNGTQVATTKWVLDKGYITGISSQMISNALGYTPYSDTNPDGFISSASIDSLSDTDITGLTNGQSLLYDSASGKWKNQSVMTSVSWGSITGTLANQTDLKNALDEKTTMAAVEAKGYSSTLDGLSDVAITSPAQGENLTYDAILGKWKNTLASATVAWGGITGNIDSQTDLKDALDSKATKVSVTNPALTSVNGKCTWTISNSLGSKKLDISIYEISSYKKVLADFSITNLDVSVELISDSDILADTYEAVIIG